MRFVRKRDEDRTEKLKSPNTYGKLKGIIAGPSKNLISDSIYRDPYDNSDGRRSHVEDQLAISYKNKCAFCERITKADIEHYRPKKEVTGEQHQGYYWLCYEWSNLIPSCITCNREGAKHSHFPILGVRVQEPSFLENGELDLEKFKAGNSPLNEEIPYLLHPEINDPEKFFCFEIDQENKGIRLVGTDDLGRGKTTINICLLNRQELRLDRVAAVISSFVDAVRAVFAKLEKGVILEDQLIDRLNEIFETLDEQALNVEKTYTLLRKYIVRNVANFESIVIPFLPSSERNVVLEAFKAYKDYE